MALTIVATAPLAAQEPQSSPDSLIFRLASAQRATVTRPQLEAALAEIDVILASSGYSAAIKSQKQNEAALIRRRLTEGDIRPGDVIVLRVANEPDLTGDFLVSTSRTIVIPAVGEIQIGTQLRSELEAYLTTQLTRFVRDPLVRAEPQIRIAIFGGVGRQGFFVAPANALLTDVIMQSAGGVAGNAQLNKSSIKRNDVEILDRDGFQAALRNGLSLDQLNIQAGDEIHVGRQRSGRWPVIAAITTASGLIWTLTRIGLF
jgi:protein involved in polysaccharide export with SLBB domain